ncbi:hypothetical protein [Budvicia aquatica]|uniref:Uncharacterized protein n=1 Tax=Budvicia aquatica TaxID=82979 RepID=A0A484ZLR9_9GAMM|nr:hypothetical protein [Budvicia aquatica]VFS49145.1 Uncharacterised protein [Budvicia aquatica]
MALQVDGYVVVKSNNRRECNFYINYLRTQAVVVSPIYSSYLDNNKSINDSIKYTIKDRNLANKIIREMFINLNESLIDEDKFGWIKYNERACQWLWLKLKIMPTTEIEHTYSPYREHSQFAYDNFIQAEIAINIKDKYKKIITFFDNWPANIETKEIKLNQYSCLWSMAYKNLLSIDWLDENDIGPMQMGMAVFEQTRFKHQLYNTIK